MTLTSGTPMPSFDGATAWLNGQVSPENLLGAPTLVAFWAVSCYYCKLHLPLLNTWTRDYGAQGARFVFVHMPRQESDMDIDSVQTTVAQFGITVPVAIDGRHEIGGRFQTSGYWPYYFLFDRAGLLKARAAGDVGPEKIEGALRRLLSLESTLDDRNDQ